jgi:hypothetical protein
LLVGEMMLQTMPNDIAIALDQTTAKVMDAANDAKRYSHSTGSNNGKGHGHIEPASTGSKKRVMDILHDPDL